MNNKDTKLIADWRKEPDGDWRNWYKNNPFLKNVKGEKLEEIIVNGKTYYSSKTSNEFQGDWKIVVLQRGWVIVGKMEKNGSECKVHHAAVIRNWGTTKGLGEIAKDGPTKDTKLDPTNGTVEFDYLTVVATIAINEAKWASKL